MTERKIELYEDDDLEAATAPDIDQLRRPLRHGECVPPIPSIYEQLTMAAMTPRRPAKTASR